MNSPVVETKAQRVERLKRALDPWQHADDMLDLARGGFGAIPPEWLNTYFRWWGIYTQGDGVGAVGGSGGEGKAVPYFMVRIRIPGGLLSSGQLRVVAAVAERHARGVADITVRENLQLHWVAAESLPDVFAALTACGLTSMGTCGDVTRNVTGCPVAGVDADEIVDASALVLEATRAFNGNPDFANLPRKYKTSITGCPVWCSYPEINDLALTGVRHPETGEVGFSVRVGGGLSTTPHLALRLDAFVRPDEVLAVFRGVSEIFRDSDVLRENREKARLKFLFLTHGWTVAKFQSALEDRLGWRLAPGVPEAPPSDAYRDHVGVHRQKQPGLHYVGASVLRGRLDASQLHRVADLAERHGSGALRTTTMQNLLVLGVPEASVPALVRDLRATRLRVAASPFWRGTVACTGTEFCKLALTETKGFAASLVADLERRLPGFDEHVRIHVTGCPNSCGQHWIADIGIEGKKMKVDGQLVDAYYFCLGGAVGAHQAPARPIGFRTPATDVAAAIERLLRGYLGARIGDESFRQFCARHDDGALRALLAGEPVAAVARDPASGRVPGGVDG